MIKPKINPLIFLHLARWLAAFVLSSSSRANSVKRDLGTVSNWPCMNDSFVSHWIERSMISNACVSHFEHVKHNHFSPHFFFMFYVNRMHFYFSNRLAACASTDDWLLDAARRVWISKISCASIFRSTLDWKFEFFRSVKIKRFACSVLPVHR